VCRDAAVMYATIFHRLGWATTFNYPAPTHVNLIIKNVYDNGTVRDFMTCTVDQSIYKCDTY
jgi:hypothetical protein